MNRVTAVIRPALVVLLVLVLLCALLVTLAVLAQRRLVYLPDASAVAPVEQYFPAGREVTLHTDDDLEIEAWFVPAERAEAEHTILVAPGNAGNRESRVPLAQALTRAGFDVLLLEYRGYGGNPGRPTETGLRADARAAREYLVTEARVEPRQMIYFGESLGAGVVTGLATEHPPAGLVLRSPFIDLAEAGAAHYPFLPVRTMLWDRFPVAEQIADVDVPVTVIYGTQDTIVPPEQSRSVADQAAGPTTVVEIPAADHNDPAMFSGDRLVTAVEELAAQLR
ncbi:alpha/beta hydrolase [Natronosporangium hydrolyticum]|uniref:Alpha/beta hydrolase n=1 Tax=Natronosporangium hydrolyticum TaxID=2811111 RepID=A0A895YF88_9ACTN|nr:alpha/beta hydrolase [Natronosporangium hydrolyticum]QSB16477.1 alpha/beta hydrolase [Natronosporangium hydrolyticum]